MHKPKVILVIMDGWGYSPIKKGNAIWQAKTPTFDYLWGNYTHLLLNSFGENVGLPWGAIGSSEVGHTSIGSGKLIHQELSLIDKEIADGSFFENKRINEIIDQVEKTGKAIHLIGLVSNGGVHSHIEHLYALLKLLKERNFKAGIFIHVMTDGRDTSPKSAGKYIQELIKNIDKLKSQAKIASVSGRYFALDRDSRWDRVKKAYLAMTGNVAKRYSDPFKAIEANYKKGKTDEFIEPSIIEITPQRESFFNKIFNSNQSKESITGAVSEGDGVIFFNIRPDRMRELTEMFLFRKNEIKTLPVKNVKVLTLTTYNEFLPVSVAYPTEKINNPLAKILSDNGFKQGHFAETEKYAHVTYFFNGGNSIPNHGELWELVPSPKVTTYDLTPTMSASKITDKVFEVLKKDKLDFVLINYANADMVGHTGVFNKVVKAVEAVDQEIKRLMEFLPETIIVVTADHGNAECMIHPETGEIDKRHSVNPVPFILVNDKYKKKYADNQTLQPSGILADIAPTILYLFGLKKDPDMNGVNLIKSLR